MVAAMRRHVAAIYTIELDPGLYAAANRRFARHRSIHVLQGDSGTVLGRLIAEIPEPCLFWLDGHYSGGVTARGPTDTPILTELEHVLSRGNLRDVILIDDARCFSGEGGYPTLEQLKAQLRAARPAARITVLDDIIRVAAT
jgi:hypothetical protein